MWCKEIFQNNESANNNIFYPIVFRDYYCLCFIARNVQMISKCKALIVWNRNYLQPKVFVIRKKRAFLQRKKSLWQKGILAVEKIKL
jgi:hypothetical protein